MQLAPFTSINSRMTDLGAEATYNRQLEGRIAPRGFLLSTASIRFSSSERPATAPHAMNVSLLATERPTDSFAGVLTQNRFCGAPVQLARERLGGEKLQALLVNNKVANVGAPGGLEAAKAVAATVASAMGIDEARVLSVSTGIIGWRLPVLEISTVVPDLVAGLGTAGPGDVARAMMTTDSYPKARSVQVGDGAILGIVKGAGMIEPNMGTMLAFFLTDLTVEREVFARSLRRAVDTSFNAISVDGDQSTSDMAVGLSSGAAGGIAESEFEEALTGLAEQLAEDIVRNGEGVSHVLRVAVSGAPTTEVARAAGKAVVNSPLVKTAVYGNDPNVGRIVAALGDWASTAGVDLEIDRLTVVIGGVTVFADGRFRLGGEVEERLVDYFRTNAMDPTVRGYPQHDRCLDLSIDLAMGAASFRVLGADLSYEYVRENADYRT